MKTRNITLLALCLITVYIPQANAGKVSASMTVSATVVESCKVSTNKQTATDKNNQPIASECNSNVAYESQTKNAPAESIYYDTQANSFEVKKTAEGEKIIEILY